MHTPYTRILLIRPSALGDVCRTVPVLASLRRAYPDARIDWLVRDSFADAVRHHPALTRVVPFARSQMGAQLRRGRMGLAARFLHDLRAGDYDLVIDCQGLLRSGLFAWATRAAVRIGPADAREGAPWFYTHRVRIPQAQIHTVDRMLALLEDLGIEPVRDMRLYTSPQDRAWAHEACDGRTPVVLAPTSAWPAKRWPCERFCVVARELARRHPVAIVSAPDERGQIAPLLDLAASHKHLIDLAGRTTVGQLMALIERASLVIANDSAAVHMGVGLGRPLIALYGPTDTRRVGPYGRERDVIQHLRSGDLPDHKRPESRVLMERIGVGEVLQRAETLLTRSASQSRA